MSKTKPRSQSTSGSYETRLVAAQSFQKGDRVRHRVTGKLGAFQEINLGYALPEVWVQFESDSEISIPTSCNPLDLELVNRGSNQLEEMQSACELEAEATPVTAVEVLPSVMSEAEARQCIEEINSSINRIRLLLVELESREGYAALGFANMSQLMQSDLFAKARSTLQKELQAGRIERHYLNVPIGTFSESHLRPFTKLKPDYYKQAVDKAFSIADIRPVTAKDMSQAVAELMRSHPDAAKRGIVERLKEKPLVLAKDFCELGDVFVLKGLVEEEHKYNGYWAIAFDVKDFTVVVDVHDTTLTVKPENLNSIDEPDVRRQLPQILKRIRRLRDCGLLDRCAYTVLESLGQQTYLTPLEEKFLKVMEQEYGIND